MCPVRPSVQAYTGSVRYDAEVELQHAATFCSSSEAIGSTDDVFVKYGAEVVGAECSGHCLSCPRKVRLHNFHDVQVTVSNEPMHVRLPNLLSYGIGGCGQIGSAMQSESSDSNRSSPRFAAPPGLERMLLSRPHSPNGVPHLETNECESQAVPVCAKHSLRVCNRMLHGKTCTNADCWSKSKLCHERECCANKARPRAAAGDKQAARALARQVKVELEKLAPALLATRVNEKTRGLGYKWRALEILQNHNPNCLPEDSREQVVKELWKTLADDSTAFRIRESAKKVLEVWGPQE